MHHVDFISDERVRPAIVVYNDVPTKVGEEWGERMKTAAVNVTRFYETFSL